MSDEYTPLNDESDTSSIWSNCGLTKQDCKALGHCSAPTPRSDDGELLAILKSVKYSEPGGIADQEAVAALQARDKRIEAKARADELAKVDQAYIWGSVVTHDGFKKWMHNRLVKIRAALTPKSTGPLDIVKTYAVDTVGELRATPQDSTANKEDS
jgi:hypothetical protein